MWGEHEQNYNNIYNGDHQAEFSHEAVAGGAAFFAVHEWEKRQQSEGKPVHHEFAKEMLAGLAGAEVDKMCETKGMDYIDRERAKRQAQQQAVGMYDQQYGNAPQGGSYW